jgi:mono/diheme cytochrome c family protein
MKAILIAACSILVASLAAAQSQPAPVPPAPGDVAKGRAAFVDYNCSWCHGTEGQGGLPAVGPRVARVPRSLQSFIEYVRKPTIRMSAYSEASVSDAVLTDIYAYLRALPEAKPAAELPLLQQMRKPGGGRN